MRRLLQQQEGERKRFRATFARAGKKINFKGYSETTALLTNLMEVSSGKNVCDHLWLTMTEAMFELRLQPGMTIEFDARIKAYKKGYVNKSIGATRQTKDFKLSHPTKFQIITA